MFIYEMKFKSEPFTVKFVWNFLLGMENCAETIKEIHDLLFTEIVWAVFAAIDGEKMAKSIAMDDAMQDMITVLESVHV